MAATIPDLTWKTLAGPAARAVKKRATQWAKILAREPEDSPARAEVEIVAASLHAIVDAIETAGDSLSSLREEGWAPTPEKRGPKRRPVFAEGDTVRIRPAQAALYSAIPQNEVLHVRQVVQARSQKPPTAYLVGNAEREYGYVSASHVAPAEND